MLPLLREGRDVVYVVSKDKCSYDISDVVLYKRCEQLVLHRIISKEGSLYEIMGDNQYVSETVPENQIIGVMTAFARNGKETLREDLNYQKYVKKIMNMSINRRKVLAKIRKKV